MKPIEMPVQMLTESSIWNSFRSSGKRHLILTGTRGSGKSTLLNKLIGDFMPGIRTWAEPGEGVYMQEQGRDDCARIGSYTPSKARMTPVPDGFLDYGIPALHRLANCDAPRVFLDEIGFLEAACPEYCIALNALLDSKPTLAALRKQDLPFLNAIRNREDVFLLDLDAPFGRGGCVVMASGLGKRFGGNKLMAQFRGRPLIAGCLHATEHLPCRVVVTRSPEVAGYCRERGAQTILHSLPHRSDTVRLGTRALLRADYLIFCQADQPLVSRDTIAAMAMLGAQKNAPILRAGTKEHFGSPMLFPKRCFGDLQTLPEGKGGSYAAKLHPGEIAYIPVQNELELKDIDTQEDLAQMQN